jgi:hypothetical protein
MGLFLRVALCRMFVFVRPGRQRMGTRSARRPALRAVLTKVLALQVELCLPKLVSSPAPGGLDRRTSGFQPESWPQGQSNEFTPLPVSRLRPAFRQTLLDHDTEPGRRVVAMSGLMAKIRKWLGLGKKS